MERKYPYNHERFFNEAMIPIETAYAPPEFMGILQKEPEESRTDGTFGAPKPGSFKRANDAIDILVDNGIPVSVISTLNSENVLHLETFYEY